MKRNLYTLAILMLTLVSCEQKPSLQKYFVEKGEAKNFVTLDLGTNFIKADKMKLSAEETKALESMKKLNVLVFQSNGANGAEFDKEKANVKELLKTDNYEELMKVNTSEGGMSVSTKGEGEHIEEFVVFLNRKETGFGVIRVLGEDMTPQNVLTMVGLLQKSNLDTGQLKPLMSLMQK